jgi:hypothetical protein
MRQRGFVMASLLITTTLVVMMGLAITQLVVNNYNLASEEQYRINAQLGADAGLDYSIAQLNLDNSWIGTGSEIILIDTGDIKVTYESTVNNGADSSEKFVNSIGRTYAPATASTPKVSREYEVDLRGIGPLDLGTFSVVTGVGGLIMENSSKIVAGDVFVNGEITMQNSTQIGLSNASVNVRAAHQNCPSPADSSYPRVCNLGEAGEPISLNNSAHIYAEVQARNQTTTSGMSNPGLVAGSPDPVPLPDHDRNAQIAAVSNNLTGVAASCNSNNGVATIPANTKITGNVSWQKKCKITILGNVWITGNLNMTTSAQLIAGDSLGTNMPTVMVDGSTGVTLENSSRFTANSSGTGVRLITYKSNASCSPDCDDVTGTDLFNSRNTVTIRMKNSFQAPESILYARWTQLLIENSGDIGALLGQTVKLQNSTIVTFGASVLGGGGSGPERTWIIDTYRRVYN